MKGIVNKANTLLKTETNSEVYGKLQDGTPLKGHKWVRKKRQRTWKAKRLTKYKPVVGKPLTGKELHRHCMINLSAGCGYQ